MKFEWDEAKRSANLAKHDLDFEDLEAFDWLGSIRRIDARKDYGEKRFIALGHFRERVHSVSFTMRGEKYRIISFRKANERETKRYEEEKNV
jgi:uncharacterized DUF497 family protein